MYNNVAFVTIEPGSVLQGMGVCHDARWVHDLLSC